MSVRPLRTEADLDWALAQIDSLVELYIAYLDRVPESEGMAFWIGRYRAGLTLDQIGEAFYAAALRYPDLTGYREGMTNEDFVSLVYRNVLGRETPDADGLAFWSGELASGHASRGTLVAAILQSAHTFKGHADSIVSLAYAPDGDRLASASRDKTIKLWDVAQRKELTTLQGHTDVINTVTYSPDGKQIASGSLDQTVKLWDVAALK